VDRPPFLRSSMMQKSFVHEITLILGIEAVFEDI